METTKNNANAPLMTGVDIIGLVFRKWKLIVCLSLILAALVSAGAFFLTKDNSWCFALRKTLYFTVLHLGCDGDG